MIYKEFRINIILRILLISFTIWLFFFILLKTEFYVTLFFVGALILIEIYTLIYYIDRTNRDLTNLLNSIRFLDFSQTFAIKKGSTSYIEFKKAFNEVIARFKKVKEEKEEQYHYLQNVIKHVGIALIAYQKNGKVEIVNNTAKKLFRINNLRNIILLEEFSKKLADAIINIKSGERSLIKVYKKNEMFQLAIYATEFTLNERIIKLVSIQNIHSELEEQEMEAWQKLIRILTHEIMNSITPIESISNSVNNILIDIKNDDEIGKQIDTETITDIQKALNTIHNRSVGLQHFVEKYRNLTAIPKPNFKKFLVKELFHHIILLSQEELKEKKINFQQSIFPQSLQLTADENLVQQVIINLLKNSIQGINSTEKPKIEMKAFKTQDNKILIQIIDNGMGIPEDSLDKIFIPFYTTKKDGSGIGLSLSRQIMRMHGGKIKVISEPEIKTEFTLEF